MLHPGYLLAHNKKKPDRRSGQACDEINDCNLNQLLPYPSAANGCQTGQAGTEEQHGGGFGNRINCANTIQKSISTMTAPTTIGGKQLNLNCII